MPMGFNAAMAAVIVVVVGLVLILLSRRSFLAREKGSKKVKQAHESNRLGQFMKSPDANL